MLKAIRGADIGQRRTSAGPDDPVAAAFGAGGGPIRGVADMRVMLPLITYSGIQHLLHSPNPALIVGRLRLSIRNPTLATWSRVCNASMGPISDGAVCTPTYPVRGKPDSGCTEGDYRSG